MRTTQYVRQLNDVKLRDQIDQSAAASSV